MPKNRLTRQQDGFARSIAHDGFNQSDAYRANYATEGWSLKQVNSEASKTANLPHVSQRITDLESTIQAQLDVSQGQILGELRGIAFGNVADLMSWGPTGVDLKSSDDLDRSLTALVSEVQETRTEGRTSIKLKVHDKLAALKEINKIKGYYAAEPTAPVDTALAAILKVAEMLSDAELRGMAAGRGPVVIEGESHEV